MKMNATVLTIVAVAVIVATYIFISYRSGDIHPFGTFKPSKKVTLQFERFELPKDYQYYAYRESPTEILALVGLEPHYTLIGDAWQGFDPDEAMVARLLEQIFDYRTDGADGYTLADPDKAPMGIFYTSLPDPVVQVNARLQEVIFTLDVPTTVTDGEL